MADRTGIEWTDATWQVTHGCSVVSPGCTNCYAMRMAARLERMGRPQYAGLTQPSKAGPVWNGTVREADLGDVPLPLRWKKPRRIFVDSMSDLFHDDVSSDHIAHVFGIMACAQQHVFQVLTKRPQRAAALIGSARFIDEVLSSAADYAHLVTAEHKYADMMWLGYGNGRPLPNVWMGTSVEDQPRADERIPHLLATPARVHFLSAEPLLGPVNLARIRTPPEGRTCGVRIDWVICGGESGPHARPMHPDWARSLRDQCAAAGVPFFMKQMAKKAPIPDDLMMREFPHA